MGLTRTRLSVCENGTIIPLKATFNDRQHRIIVNFQLSCIRIKSPIESIIYELIRACDLINTIYCTSKLILESDAQLIVCGFKLTLIQWSKPTEHFHIACHHLFCGGWWFQKAGEAGRWTGRLSRVSANRIRHKHTLTRRYTTLSL